ncbi:MAG: M20/M25/M40 family metallo-hydrolase [Phycisphaerales bacterium]|nr:M20/M25/M40 family metallo-hydrolase [Phycisphaerales bacterium]
MPAPTAQPAIDWLDANESASIDRLLQWLRLPSVGTDPAHDKDTRAAGQWAADHLRESGFDVELMPTGTADSPGHPIVLAHCDGAAEYTGPHILFYGHYDVQPVDPIELWNSPPFEPVVLAAENGIGERVVARGACDDKGQVHMFLEAMRAWKEGAGETGGGVRFTVLLEGEEESGSVNLEQFVRDQAEMLGKADVCLISDTGMLGRGKPAITYGVRGLAYTEVVLHSADQDLHSGLWGGKVPNPINELVKVLSGLWDDDRRVTIPGFYDGVRELQDSERKEWESLGVNPAKGLAAIGLSLDASVGEKGYSYIEREWARPTCDINGIIGGYTGPGAKTVIPSHASAKVSFRLVDDMDSATISKAFFAWCEARTPAGCRWEFDDHGGGAPATCATDSVPLQAARRAIARACKTTPAMIKSGGSIPVAGLLKDELGLETIFMGFGLEDDRVHSPNEKFELDCFRMGARSHAALIEELRSL